MADSTAIYVGNVKGILGLDDNSVTGLVIDSISFDNQTTEAEYMDINNDVTSVAFTNHRIEISIDGRKLDGTAVTTKVATALTLTTMANYLPTGYTTGGTNIVKSINESQAIGDYQKLSIRTCHYPKVATV